MIECNAKIKFSYLGFREDNCVLWWQLGFVASGGEYETEKICVNGPKQIVDILNVLDLHYWEEVSRKYARIRVNDKGKVAAIGNLIANKWLILEAYENENEKENNM